MVMAQDLEACAGEIGLGCTDRQIVETKSNHSIHNGQRTSSVDRFFSNGNLTLFNEASVRQWKSRTAFETSFEQNAFP